MFNLRTTEMISFFCLGLASLGAVLRAFAIIRLRAHLRPAPPETTDPQPLTLWRALKPGVPDLPGKLRALVEGSRPGDQVLIGCDAADAPACAALRREFPEREITVIVCKPDCAANPKISKFAQMTPHARHTRWMLTDSEAMVTRDFIDGLRSEWVASGADALTAGYRFANPRTFAASLDTLPAMTTLWPGLMLAGRPDFTLGACTALHAADVAAVGGWDAFGDDLAEDHRLGQSLAAAGRNIRLSRHVLTLDSDPVTLREMLRHQHRVAVTYRVASPLGAVGLPILHCWPLLLAALLLGAGNTPAKGVACGVTGIAWLASTFATARAIHGKRPPFLALALAPLVEAGCWLCAWFSPAVFWAGRWRRVDWRGRFRHPPRGS